MASEALDDEMMTKAKPRRPPRREKEKPEGNDTSVSMRREILPGVIR